MARLKFFIFGPKFLRHNFFVSQMFFKEFSVDRNSLKVEKPIEGSMKSHNNSANRLTNFSWAFSQHWFGGIALDINQGMLLGVDNHGKLHTFGERLVGKSSRRREKLNRPLLIN